MAISLEKERIELRENGIVVKPFIPVIKTFIGGKSRIDETKAQGKNVL